MIRAEQLGKRFGPFTAIEDVSFTVDRGAIVGFLGPNGAGKTTTMRVLAGVFPPTQGRAYVAGHDIVADPLRARAAVGYFPERVALYLDMTVRAYLTYVASLKNLRGDAAGRALWDVIGRCGLRPVAERVIGSLSKGFRQRVGIAQAMLGDPPILILDEPTSGLDPEQVAEMRALIRELRGERTVILSTHILSEVEATCDRVIIMNRGRIVAVDTPENLNRRLRPASQVDIEASGPEREIVERLRAVPGVISVDRRPGGANGAVALRVSTEKNLDLREVLAATLLNCGWGLRELRSAQLSLEEIFLELVGRREGEERTGQ